MNTQRKKKRATVSHSRARYVSHILEPMAPPDKISRSGTITALGITASTASGSESMETSFPHTTSEDTEDVEQEESIPVPKRRSKKARVK
jgi:hypothetical protein